jgi:hypothetical protein
MLDAKISKVNCDNLPEVENWISESLSTTNPWRDKFSLESKTCRVKFTLAKSQSCDFPKVLVLETLKPLAVKTSISAIWIISYYWLLVRGWN